MHERERRMPEMSEYWTYDEKGKRVLRSLHRYYPQYLGEYENSSRLSSVMKEFEGAWTQLVSVASTHLGRLHSCYYTMVPEVLYYSEGEPYYCKFGPKGPRPPASVSSMSGMMLMEYSAQTEAHRIKELTQDFVDGGLIEMVLRHFHGLACGFIGCNGFTCGCESFSPDPETELSVYEECDWRRWIGSARLYSDQGTGMLLVTRDGELGWTIFPEERIQRIPMTLLEFLQLWLRLAIERVEEDNRTGGTPRTKALDYYFFAEYLSSHGMW